MKEGFSIGRLRAIVLILLSVLGFNALIAGYSLMTEPSGSELGLKPVLLSRSPFTDFFIPGLILFWANGVLSFSVAAVTLLKRKYYPALISVQGIVLVGWIVLQIALLRIFNVLQLVMGLLGIFLILMGFLIRKRLETESAA